MSRELFEMGIELVDALVHRVCFGEITLEIESPPVPLGILVDDVAELILEEISGLRSSNQTSPA